MGTVIDAVTSAICVFVPPSWTISQAAPTLWISVPNCEIMLADHIRLNMGTEKGGGADVSDIVLIYRRVSDHTIVKLID